LGPHPAQRQAIKHIHGSFDEFIEITLPPLGKDTPEQYVRRLRERKPVPIPFLQQVHPEVVDKETQLTQT
jgi:hypothetical protein